ncbi:hypothetical protein [Methanothrix sp.]|jgi:Predicted integral membrane protein|uniref:hypothetical protein n=1 Tax=Methanothrix sp. TaxID=90426 RepID=UPI001E7BCB53|nr:hypothetical protein [Methanothrix sp.]UEC40108.1 MAG: conserved membrane protein of unknown function [Methanothrix sp.]
MKWPRINREYAYILSLFLVTRIALVIIGIISKNIIDHEHYWDFSNYVWLNIWSVWDSGWYHGIAKNGYLTVDISKQSEFAFFPLYPLFMRGLGQIIGDVDLAGIVISNVSLLIACIILYRLAKLDADEAFALRSVKFMMLFPTAFIYSGIFTESLFLALALGCFYYSRLGKWYLVGILGFCLTLTRSLGILILLPMAYEYWKAKPPLRNALFLIMIPLGLFAFMAFCYIRTGDPIAFVHVQAAWGRVLVNPVVTIYKYLLCPEFIPQFLAVFALVSLGVMTIFVRRIRSSYWLFGICVLLIPLSTGIESMGRYPLTCWPLFLIPAQTTKYEELLTVALALLQGGLMVFWCTGSHLIL